MNNTCSGIGKALIIFFERKINIAYAYLIMQIFKLDIKYQSKII